MGSPMQPLYATMGSNTRARDVHSPGSFRSGRATMLHGWVNSAIGTLMNWEAHCDGQPAGKQEASSCLISVPKDANVRWDAENRQLTITRPANLLGEVP